MLDFPRNEPQQLNAEQLIVQYLPEKFRNFIEQNYYDRVTQQAVLEHIIDSKEFLDNPIDHIALYSDHGVVHVRDVAREIIMVINSINGILIPSRQKKSLEFMRGYGTAVAYLHDIGMRDFSAFGRFMHPEFAAQSIFTEEFDEYINLIWSENAGNIAWRLLSLASKGVLVQKPKSVLREMLAMAMCHSKSKVPVEVLNDPQQLRDLLINALKTNLYYLYLVQQFKKAERGLTQSVDKENPTFDPVQAKEKYEQVQAALKKYQATTEVKDRVNVRLEAYYQNFEVEAFQWLVSDEPKVKRLIADVIDTLRALRCADALRQRGTVYRTSAGYEVFVDQRSANAIYALRNRDNSQLFLYEAKRPLNAGEANLASSELDAYCNLRVSFHRGSFASSKAIKKAAYNAAIVINDIQADVIMSFKGVHKLHDPTAAAHIKKEEDIQILIEGVDDNPAFAELVCKQLEKIDSVVGKRSQTVVSLQNADLDEVNRYVNGNVLDESQEELPTKREILERIAYSGHDIERMDVETAFKEVKLISVSSGEILIKGGTPSGFVYIPFNDGLQVFPLGGYTSVPARAWVPLGNTGVIRGSIRNANVVADNPITLLMIPRQVYLMHWYHPYSSKRLSEALRNMPRNIH